MKQIIISHTTALKAFRLKRTGMGFESYIDSLSSFILKSNRSLDRWQASEAANKIDILVNNKNKVHSCRKYKIHLAPGNFANNMLIKFSDSIYCVAPELLICLLAQTLSYENLAILIHEFCGNYSFVTDLHQINNDINPITNVQKISEMVSRLSTGKNYFRGLKNLNEILKFAGDNSRSPMESRMNIKLCGPHRKGCYACRGLRLNVKVKLSDEAKMLAGQMTVTPDLCNVEKKIAIEYDSAQFHENVEQGQRDKRRRDALVHDGWQVFTILPATINDPKAFNIIAEKILTGLDQDTRFITDKFKLRQLLTFENLK